MDLPVPRVSHLRSLKTRVTLGVLVIVIVILWMSALVASRLLQGDLEGLLAAQEYSAVSFLADNIDRELAERANGLGKVAASIDAAMLADPRRLQILLEERPVLQQMFNWGILVLSQSGNAVANYPAAMRRTGISFADDEAFRLVLGEGKAVIGDPLIGRKTKQPVFDITVPIFDVDRHVIGALKGVTNLALPNFLDEISKHGYGKTGAYLVAAPKAGLFVAASDRTKVMQPTPAPGVSMTFDRQLAGDVSAAVSDSYLGVENLASTRHIPGTDWFAIATLPTEEAFAPVRALQMRFFIAAALLTLTAGLLAWWLLRRELAPLADAALLLRQMSTGQLPRHPLPVVRDDEFGLVARNFNDLLASIKEADAALQIAATAFESQEGMFITDASGVILRVNHAFTDITGYSPEEAVGQTSALLKSGRHDAAFYEAMWGCIRRTGFWQGEIWNRRKNGEEYPEWLTIAAVKGNDGGASHYVSTLTDITERKAAADEIQHLAFYDSLTRLPNRRLLLDRLQQALASSARSGREGALLFIDLDDFKTLNDTLGHDKGDLLLQQVGQRLATCVREGDTVARLGGDEFVVMLEDLSENAQEAATQAELVGEKILATLNQNYQLAGQDHHSTPSIGVTLFADHLDTVDELLKRADLAMYQAKAAGRNTLRFFDPVMQAAVTSRAALEVDLREGVHKEQFILYYQPQVDAQGRLTGAEALLRWQHPLRGLVPPAEFIPLAEETGLIMPLGHWVLEQACAQLVAWATDPDMAHLTLAVNVSARQFRHPDFVDQTLAILDHTGANPQKLKLELTESLLLDDVEDIIAKMSALKAEGVSFSLDDFGTGYSSLSYLKRLPLFQLKIDQSFVRDVLTDSNDAAIARTIVALAQSLGLAVIAEGVETEGQMDFLTTHGCTAYQGFFFARPLPLAEFTAFMRRSLPGQSRLDG